MKKLFLIAGLPCSGKTTYAIKLNNDLHGLLIDDPKDLKTTLSLIKEQEKIIIVDPFFIYSKLRIRTEEILYKEFPDSEIKWIFFENDKNFCLKNYFSRFKNGDQRNVKSFIRLGSLNYQIPKNSFVLPCWKSTHLD